MSCVWSRAIALPLGLLLLTSAPRARAAETAPHHHGSAQAAAAPLLNRGYPTASLSEIIAAALAANHELRETAARSRASAARAGAVSSWPDPMVRYELWAAPLNRPYDPQMHMLGVSQVIPAPGTVSARADAALEQAKASQALVAARTRDVVTQVRRSYAEYSGAYHEYQVHLEHMQLNNALVELARAAYQAGRGSQRDVLKTALELARVHNDLIGLEQRIRSSRAALNALMARPPDAPIGPPEPTSLAQSKALAVERFDPADRAEVAAAQRVMASREQELKAARSAANWPEFMVQAQYMYMPMEMDPHAYGVMLSMSVPWFNSSRRDEVRAAEHTLAAEREALATLTVSTRYELADARARFVAAAANHAVIERELLPQARRSYESAVAVYRGAGGSMLDVLDASQTLLELRIQLERARAALLSAHADLLRARGEAAAVPAPQPSRSPRVPEGTP